MPKLLLLLCMVYVTMIGCKFDGLIDGKLVHSPWLMRYFLDWILKYVIYVFLCCILLYKCTLYGWLDPKNEYARWNIEFSSLVDEFFCLKTINIDSFAIDQIIIRCMDVPKHESAPLVAVERLHSLLCFYFGITIGFVRNQMLMRWFGCEFTS